MVERESGASFFLAATLYTNEDGVLNDDHYDYERSGCPSSPIWARRWRDGCWRERGDERHGAAAGAGRLPRRHAGRE
ncbi:MAG: hypothetical protein U0002_13635 [Thermoanaerobaculia bacterium]